MPDKIVVKGYKRSDGSRVKAHERTKPRVSGVIEQPDYGIGPVSSDPQERVTRGVEILGGGNPRAPQTQGVQVVKRQR